MKIHEKRLWVSRTARVGKTMLAATVCVLTMSLAMSGGTLEERVDGLNGVVETLIKKVEAQQNQIAAQQRALDVLAQAPREGATVASRRLSTSTDRGDAGGGTGQLVLLDDAGGSCSLRAMAATGGGSLLSSSCDLLTGPRQVDIRQVLVDARVIVPSPPPRPPLPPPSPPSAPPNSNEFPAASCMELKAQGFVSGTYFLTHSGQTQRAFCDMVMAGGGWEKIDFIKSKSGAGSFAASSYSLTVYAPCGGTSAMLVRRTRSFPCQNKQTKRPGAC